MSETARTSLRDVAQAIEARDPELAALLVRYLAQDDPEPGHDELGTDDDTSDVEVPTGAMTHDKLSTVMSARGMANKNATERKLARRDAFALAESSTYAPPRLRIGTMLVALYERGDAEGRAALIEVFARGRMQWGVWKAAKHIYKRAEDTHDAAMYGVLAYRFDAMSSTEHREIGAGTFKYLRRRAWRWLRLLGQATPEAYPAFAVEVLRHYPADYGTYSPSWVAAQIFRHDNLKGERGASIFGTPAESVDDKAHAFPAAWRLSPAPLLQLLESAHNDHVCDWAIKLLRVEHALALRAVEPAWLVRLGRRPVAAVHGFVTSLLRESPELHQSKLEALGLHDMVLELLLSPSADARAYALEYAAAHAPDLAIARLVELIEIGHADVAKFAAARLEARSPAQLGLPVVLRLLRVGAAPWAETKLAEGFSPRDLDVTLFVDTAARGTKHFGALIKFFNDKNAAIPASYWTALVDDRRIRDDWDLRTLAPSAMAELAKRSAREIGIPWIQHALEDRNTTDAVVRWLDAGMLAGDDLDVEWLKGLVGKPRLRPVALRLLADRKRVAPARVGLAWLLELTRSSDADLVQFAQRMLLESFQPEDFADGARAAGVARLWELAAGKRSPETVRAFAATYLKAHHPELGPRLAEARALGIKPRLDHAAYALATVRPLLADDRADVRRLAAAIAGEELVRWDDRGLVYELAGSPHKEPRALGSELLLGVIVEGEVRRVPAAWLDGARLFQLAESSYAAAREVALTLIRRLYDRVGGAERLGWLMESPERDVRLFAVRLFWDRHRPVPWPKDYAPRKAVAGAAIGTARFTDLTALRQFTRTVLFGLPPGRIGERDAVVEGAPKPERPLPASVAKRRMIEALRDGGLEDLELARAIAPVLREFTASTAKGEWQASLQALTALRAHHRDAFEDATGGSA